MKKNANEGKVVRSQQEDGIQRIELPGVGAVIVVPKRTEEEWAASVAEEIETILGDSEESDGCEECDQGASDG